ncbi:MAG TPA: polyprenyl synthetase family protein [Phototrophicaceae bacterium]|nr:polyprenyl synthetase family protein [Phototrophicaceae bacterium]
MSKNLLESGMQTVENLMYSVLASDVTVLQEASRHILSAGGKRVRPRLALLSYLACGGHQVDRVAPAAAAVELVHTASVVHDDINDHGVMRRGKPSVNAIWGRTFALLTGDFLFTKVYELMAPFKDLNIVLAEATVALVEGETLQAAAVKDNNFTREVYFDIIARKTAALFKAGAIIGATMANGLEDQIDALSMYGFNLGLAFQIIDDILDLTADSVQLGKTSGIDLEQGRGLAAVYVHDAETTGKTSPADPMDTIKRKLLGGNAIEEGRQQARQLMQLAIAGLDVLPSSGAKDGLIELAHLVVERNH